MISATKEKKLKTNQFKHSITMTTKTKQRTLIKEDKAKLNAMLKDVDLMMPILNKLQSAYNDLGIGKFDNDIFQEVINRGTSEVRDRFDKKNEEEVKKAGFTSKRIIQNILMGADEDFQKFNSQVKIFKEFTAPRYAMDTTPRLPKKFVHCFHFGGFAVLEENEEQILEEYCRIYLEGPEEHEAYKKAQEFLSSFESFKGHLDKLGFKYDGDLKSIERHFITYEDGKATIKPTSIRYAISGQKEWEAQRNRNRRETQQFHREMAAPTMEELYSENQ